MFMSLKMACATLALVAIPAIAQNAGRPTEVTGPTPKTIDGHPDLSGLWSPQANFSFDISKALKTGSTIEPLPWALKLMQQRVSKDDPEANCLPTGVPRMAPYPWKIIQNKDLIAFLFEGNIHTYRQIFMDRKEHPKELNPTWFGDSIGRWDGDTLVVDTVGYNDRFWFDFTGRPHTEQLHTVERFRRPDLGTLEEEVTVEDPGAYAKPFTLGAKMPLLKGQEIIEYICNENNRDIDHITGKEGLDEKVR
jgi:hypothetical protein